MHKIAVKTDSEILRHAMKKSGNDAYQSALKAGISVTILKGNKIQRIEPSGKIVTISTIDLSNKRVLPNRIHLK